MLPEISRMHRVMLMLKRLRNWVIGSAFPELDARSEYPEC